MSNSYDHNIEDLFKIRILCDVAPNEWVDGAHHFRGTPVASPGCRTDMRVWDYDAMLKYMNEIDTVVYQMDEDKETVEWKQTVSSAVSKGRLTLAEARNEWLSRVTPAIQRYFEGKTDEEPRKFRYETCLSGTLGESEKYHRPRLELIPKYDAVLGEGGSLVSNLTVHSRFERKPRQTSLEDDQSMKAFKAIGAVLSECKSSSSLEDSPLVLLQDWEARLKATLKANVDFSKPEWKTVSLVFFREPAANISAAGGATIEGADASASVFKRARTVGSNGGSQEASVKDEITAKEEAIDDWDFVGI